MQINFSVKLLLQKQMQNAKQMSMQRLFVFTHLGSHEMLFFIVLLFWCKLQRHTAAPPHHAIQTKQFPFIQNQVIKPANN